MPRHHGSRVTAAIALNTARAAARAMTERQPAFAFEWREVTGWIEATANDLQLVLTEETVPETIAADVSSLARYLDGQLALAAALVESLAIGEAQRASEHAQRRARVAPEGGPVRTGVIHAAR